VGKGKEEGGSGREDRKWTEREADGRERETSISAFTQKHHRKQANTLTYLIKKSPKTTCL
jgi:hypothetical protein